MGAAIPVGGRLLGGLLSRAVPLERIRRAIGVLPQDRMVEGDCANALDATQCNQCRLQHGMLLPARPRRAIRKETKINYDYQLFIANLRAGPERFSYVDKDSGALLSGFDFSIAARALNALKGVQHPGPHQLNVTEWFYNGVWFDGFWRSSCTVVDAKGRYAQFLDEDGVPQSGFQLDVVFGGLAAEAVRQVGAISDAMPQAKLEWHLMELSTYRYVKDIVPPPIITNYTPIPALKA